MASHSIPSLDPRLSSPAHYSRDKIVSCLTSFYRFLSKLPHITPSAIHQAPSGGWPSITTDTLATWGIKRSSEIVDLLRHVPYIEGEQTQDFAWIAPECYPCDWRLVGDAALQNQTWPKRPRWMSSNDARHWEWPDWVVQLTCGRDGNGLELLLDTSDGTVTRFDSAAPMYTATYAVDDLRSWRDRCYDETLPLSNFLDRWKNNYVQMTFLGVPDCRLSGVYVGVTRSLMEDSQDGAVRVLASFPLHRAWLIYHVGTAIHLCPVWMARQL